MNLSIFSLVGKVALVTGATGYLGKQISLGLAESGAHVLINSRNETKALDLVSLIKQQGFSAEIAIFDVRSESEITSFFENHSQNNIDVIVNNAYAGTGGTIETSRTQDYSDAFEISVSASHNIIRNALPYLRESVKKNGYASIINIASMYGMVSPDCRLYETPQGSNPPFYGAAKAALIQLTKYAACEFGKEGIRINSISPGPFPNVENNNNAFVKSLADKVPLGRIGQAHELKGPIIFLASPASSFVNGTNLVVDGGWTIW